MAIKSGNHLAVKLLLSFLQFHRLLLALIALSKLTIAHALALPMFSLSASDYKKLPLYCAASTGYFPCADAATGSVSCHPLALRCRIHCANAAELGCSHTVTNCSAGLHHCGSRVGQPTQPPVCLPDHLLCDGRLHCPLGDDESPQLCQSRAPCRTGLFACRSAGHCLLPERRCDGFEDCRRPGLEDRSDEADCPTASRAADAVSECSRVENLCDGFPDCVDGSDERNCPAGLHDDGVANEASSKPAAAPLEPSELEPDAAVRPPILESVALATYDNSSRQASLFLISSVAGKLLHRGSGKLPAHSGLVVALDESAGRAILFDAPSSRLRSAPWLSYSDRSDFTEDFNVDLGGELAITHAAFDSTRRLLFYVSEIDGSLGVVAVDAGWRATLRLLDCPRGLLVEPDSDSLVLALSCGSAPGIYRLSMDGREMRLLLDPELVGRPVGLGFDSAARPQRLYWIDAGRLGVFSVRLEDGGDVRRHFDWPARQLEVETARLAVLGARLYVAAVSAEGVWSLRQLSPPSSDPLLEFPGAQVTILAAVSPSRSDTANGATLHRPQCACEQICLPAWPDSTKTECLSDWRHRPPHRATSRPELALKSTTGSPAETAETTAPVADRQAMHFVPVYLVAMACIFAVLTGACLWLCQPCRRQSVKLIDSVEPENVKLNSVDTVVTMLSVESRAALTRSAGASVR